MSRPCLMSLPAELTLQIFDELMDSVIPHSLTKDLAKRRRLPSSARAVLKVNQRFYSEACEVLVKIIKKRIDATWGETWYRIYEPIDPKRLSEEKSWTPEGGAILRRAVQEFKQLDTYRKALERMLERLGVSHASSFSKASAWRVLPRILMTSNSSSADPTEGSAGGSRRRRGRKNGPIAG